MQLTTSNFINKLKVIVIVILAVLSPLAAIYFGYMYWQTSQDLNESVKAKTQCEANSKDLSSQLETLRAASVKQPGQSDDADKIAAFAKQAASCTEVKNKLKIKDE
jgi:flagellar basal body-associated protein FliL